jgi:hypothetical protein
VRAKEIKAGRIRARVIHVKEIKARNGRVGRIVESDEKSWEGAHGQGELKAAEVVADTIWAKEIKADWVEAEIIYAKEAKIGKEKHHHGHDDD